MLAMAIPANLLSKSMWSVINYINHLAVWRVPIRINECRFKPPSFDRLLCLLLYKLGLYGSEEFALIRKLVRPGMHCLDIGANQGIYTTLLAQLVGPTGTVRAFEPDPLLYTSLAKNAKTWGFSYVHLHDFALGHEEGVLRLTRNPLNSGDNRLTENKGIATVEVTVKPFDATFVKAKVDFIKIDVQGWETQALAGLANTILENPEIIIVFEFWPFGLRQAGNEPLALLAFLNRLGLTVMWPRPNGSLTPFASTEAASWSKQSYYVDLIARRPETTEAPVLEAGRR